MNKAVLTWEYNYSDVEELDNFVHGISNVHNNLCGCNVVYNDLTATGQYVGSKNKISVSVNNTNACYIVEYGDGDTSYYTFEEKDNKIIMYYDKNDTGWTSQYRGIVAGTLKDTGNGFHIKLNNQKKIKLDYSQLSELLCLLEYYDDTEAKIIGVKRKVTKLFKK